MSLFTRPKKSRIFTVGKSVTAQEVKDSVPTKGYFYIRHKVIDGRIEHYLYKDGKEVFVATRFDDQRCTSKFITRMGEVAVVEEERNHTFRHILRNAKDPSSIDSLDSQITDYWNCIGRTVGIETKDAGGLAWFLKRKVVTAVFAPAL